MANDDDRKITVLGIEVEPVDLVMVLAFLLVVGYMLLEVLSVFAFYVAL